MPNYLIPRSLDGTNYFDRLKWIQRWYVENRDRRDDVSWNGRLVIGREVYKLQKRHGMSLPAIARATGIPVSWIKGCARDYRKGRDAPQE